MIGRGKPNGLKTEHIRVPLRSDGYVRWYHPGLNLGLPVATSIRKCLSTIQTVEKETKVRIKAGEQRGRSHVYWFSHQQPGALQRRALKNWRFAVQNTRTPLNFTQTVILFLCTVYLIWSLTLMEERRLKLLENRALGRIIGSRRDEVTGSGKNCIMLSWMICTAHQIECGS